MEVKRRLEKNGLELAIKDAVSSISRSEEVIKRIKSSEMNSEYVTAQIVKNKENIQNKKNDIETYREKIIKIEDGELDSEITVNYSKNADKAKEKIRTMVKTRTDKKFEEEKNNAYWNKIHSHKVNNKLEKDLRSGERYYYKVVDSFPDYMAKNLKTMPNNKGYYWRGVCFYGELPKIPGEPSILFERQGSVMLIHESTDKETRIYEKVGKEPKILKEIIKRKPKHVF
jgi:hypothetical protein